MKLWFYAKEGQKIGPVGEDQVKKLFLSGVINPNDLVWNKDFGSSWKTFASSGLILPEDLFAADQPPELPTATKSPPGKPSLDRRHPTTTRKVETSEGLHEFIGSKVFDAIVGRNAGYYRKKWSVISVKCQGNVEKSLSVNSWNWAAFLCPYAWAFYRRMYLVGTAIFLVYVVPFALSEYLPKNVSRAMSFGLVGISITAGMYGNSWLLWHTFKHWKKIVLEDPTDLLEAALERSGTDWRAVVGVLFAAVLISVAPIAFADFGQSKDAPQLVSCSSEEAIELVQQLLKKEAAKGIEYAVDLNASTVDVKSIRTRSSDNHVAECAALVSTTLMMNSEHKQKFGYNDSILNKYPKINANYKVEKTDDEQEIYVIVHGLDN